MHAINSRPLRSMTIGPLVAEIQFYLDNSKSKVKVKGTPGSTASSWLIFLVFHIRASYRLPSVSFPDNRAFHSRDTNWPWKFKVRGTLVSAASSLLISVVFHIRHPIDSCPFRSMTIGPPIPEIQKSRSKVTIKGTLVSVAFSWLISFFYFTSTGPTVPKIWQIEFSIQENRFKILWKKALKNNTVECMMRGKYLPSFGAIGWAVLPLSWGQVKKRSASVA